MKYLVIALGLMALAPLPALAGNLYKCAGADGKSVYQQTPCATKEAQLDRRSFVREPDPEPVRQIGGSETGSPGYPTWEDTHPTGTNARPATTNYRNTTDTRQPPKRAAGYECMINGVRVLRDGPCPSGSSTTRTLDRAQLCDEIRDSRDDASGPGSSKRVYNRNKARGRNNC